VRDIRTADYRRRGMAVRSVVQVSAYLSRAAAYRDRRGTEEKLQIRGVFNESPCNEKSEAADVGIQTSARQKQSLLKTKTDRHHIG